MALTSAALKAHDQLQATETTGLPLSVIDDEGDGAIASLLNAEASIARREHANALMREFEQLQELSPAEASGWQQRRERSSACHIQSAWRRRASRHSLEQAVEWSKLQKRITAATTIQRMQRMRQRVVNEVAPPISREQIEEIQQEIVERTLRLARELRQARNAREEARTKNDETGSEHLPPLPAWYTDPQWLKDIESHPVNHPIARELRDGAIQGLRADRPEQQILQQLHAWPKLRAQMQASAVRRQLNRTQTAALFAQLRHPPPLPTPQRIWERSEISQEQALPAMLNPKPSVLAAHRRALLDAKLRVEQEEQAGTSRHPPGQGAGHRAVPREPLTPKTGAAIRQRMGLSSEVDLSAAELTWLASLNP